MTVVLFRHKSIEMEQQMERKGVEIMRKRNE